MKYVSLQYTYFVMRQSWRGLCCPKSHSAVLQWQSFFFVFYYFYGTELQTDSKNDILSHMNQSQTKTLMPDNNVPLQLGIH